MDKQATTLEPSWGRRIVGIDGLRGAAAFSVLCGHVYVHLGDKASPSAPARIVLDATGAGLVLFFVLSGFLLYRPFAAAILFERQWPDPRRFLRNRALRIFPAYLVILTLTSLVIGVAYTKPASRGEEVEAAGSSVGYMWPHLKEFLVDTTMLQTYFPSTMKTGIGPAWSLTVEFTFYLCLPLLAIAALRLSGRDWRIGSQRTLVVAIPALILIIAGFVGKTTRGIILNRYPESEHFWLEWGGNWIAVFCRSILVHADLFALGMLAAVAVYLFEAGSKRRKGAINLTILALIPVGLVIAKISSTYADTGWGTLFAAIVFLVSRPGFRSQNTSLGNLLELAPFRYVGLVSYSLYLWHIPMIWVLIDLGWPDATTLPELLLSIAAVFTLSLAAASATYYAVELPALKRKKAVAAEPRGLDTPPRDRKRPNSA